MLLLITLKIKLKVTWASFYCFFPLISNTAKHVDECLSSFLSRPCLSWLKWYLGSKMFAVNWLLHFFCYSLVLWSNKRALNLEKIKSCVCVCSKWYKDPDYSNERDSVWFLTPDITWINIHFKIQIRAVTKEFHYPLISGLFFFTTNWLID